MDLVSMTTHTYSQLVKKAESAYKPTLATARNIQKLEKFFGVKKG